MSEPVYIHTENIHHGFRTGQVLESYTNCQCRVRDLPFIFHMDLIADIREVFLWRERVGRPDVSREITLVKDNIPNRN